MPAISAAAARAGGNQPSAALVGTAAGLRRLKTGWSGRKSSSASARSKVFSATSLAWRASSSAACFLASPAVSPLPSAASRARETSRSASASRSWRVQAAERSALARRAALRSSITVVWRSPSVSRACASLPFASR